MKSFDALVGVMATLRSKKGCPWDKKQTHESLVKYLFEESNELVRSIRKRDWDNLEEELGDVLFQVLFHSQIAKEAGRFTIDDVIRSQVRKLTLRHPHVFGYKKEHRALLKDKKLSLATAQDVLDNWKLLKEISKKAQRRTKR
jgi:tetrapyrrole methylase family protein / MazG family protein